MLQFDIRVTVRNEDGETDFPLTEKQHRAMQDSLIRSLTKMELGVPDYDKKLGNYVRDFRLTVADIKEVK